MNFPFPRDYVLDVDFLISLLRHCAGNKRRICFYYRSAPCWKDAHGIQLASCSRIASVIRLLAESPLDPLVSKNSVERRPIPSVEYR